MDDRTALAALGALAHETRLAVFRLLVAAGPAGLPAGSIAEAVGVVASTLSFHLKELDRAGLVHSRRRQRQVIYAADVERIGRFLAYLTEDCCGVGGRAGARLLLGDQPPRPAPPASGK